MSEAKAAKARSAGAAAESVDGEPTRPRYRRILLKLSGEALLGSRQYGVDPDFCALARSHSRPAAICPAAFDAKASVSKSR